MINARRTTDEIIARYPKLSEQVRRNLTDFYNQLIGINSIGYGNNTQRAIALEIVWDRISKGKEAFNSDPLTPRVRTQVQRRELNLPQLDCEHLEEVGSLISRVNTAAKDQRLNRDLARETYELLIPYLYGRKASTKEA